MKAKKIIAIIVTHNRLDMLKRCIDSVKKQLYRVSKIVIVDNNSTDGTKDYLKRISRNLKSIKAIFNKENAGVAKAINIGLDSIKNEKWDLVWITDDDNIANKNALLELVKKYKKNTILGPILIDHKNNKKLSIPVYDIRNPKKIYTRTKEIKKKEFIEYLTPFNFTLVPREVIYRNLLDEKYFIYGEEYDLITRLLLQGCKLLTIPKSETYCLNQKKLYKIKIFKKHFFFPDVKPGRLYYFLRNQIMLNIKFKAAIERSKNKDLIKNYYYIYKYNYTFFLIASSVFFILAIIKIHKNRSLTYFPDILRAIIDANLFYIKSRVLKIHT